MTNDNIILDPSILVWVLMPIVVVMYLQGILRQHVSVLLADQNKSTLSMVHKNFLLRRSGRLRANGQFIPASAFRMRKSYFVNKAFYSNTSQSGKSSEGSSTSNTNESNQHQHHDNQQEQQKQSPAMEDTASPMSDPFAMVSMMKQNMAMIIPNMLLMGWTSYFFSGFVLVKLPFGLSHRFKAMLQRGIFLRTLDPSYVSSLSWYFITLFGLRGLFSLVLGEGNATDNTKIIQEQLAGSNMQQVDYNQLFSVEKTELEIQQHEWVISSAETRLLETENE